MSRPRHPRSPISLAAAILLAIVACSEFAAGCVVEIPATYSRMERPPQKEEGAPVNVSMRIVLTRFAEVNDIGMYFSAAVGLAMRWTDRRVAMDCPLREEIDPIQVNQLWKPDYYFYSSVKVDRSMVYEDSTHLKSIGKSRFLWYPKMNIKIGCDMDFSEYPMDTQDCFLRVGSVTANPGEIVWTSSMYEYLEHFNMVKIQYEYELEDIKWEDFTGGFVVRLKRKFAHFVLNVYLPTGLLVISSFISFIIPRDKSVAGRMGLLVTVFLTLANISSSERNRAPKADGLTSLDTWLLTCMLFVAAAIFEYSLVILMSRHGSGKLREKNELQRAWVAEADGEKDDNNSAGSRNNNTGKWNWDGMCDAVDRGSLAILIVLFVIFNGVYWSGAYRY